MNQLSAARALLQALARCPTTDEVVPIRKKTPQPGSPNESRLVRRRSKTTNSRCGVRFWRRPIQAGDICPTVMWVPEIMAGTHTPIVLCSQERGYCYSHARRNHRTVPLARLASTNRRPCPADFRRRRDLGTLNPKEQ